MISNSNMWKDMLDSITESHSPGVNLIFQWLMDPVVVFFSLQLNNTESHSLGVKRHARVNAQKKTDIHNWYEHESLLDYTYRYGSSSLLYEVIDKLSSWTQENAVHNWHEHEIRLDLAVWFPVSCMKWSNCHRKKKRCICSSECILYS